MLSNLLLALPLFAQPAAPAAPTTQPAARVLHLDDALKSALARQPAVLQAQAATRASSGRAEQARSGLFPQITASAIYQRRYGSTTSTTPTTGGAGTPTPVTGGAFNFFSFGVTANQLIWDFGQTYERSRAASRTVESVRASERTAEQQVLLGVRRAFFQARAQRALIRVAEDTLANHAKHLAQIQGFVSVGTRPEIDLAQARADLANDRVAILNAQNGYDLAKSQLNQAMGVVTGIDFDVAEEDVGPVDGEELPLDRLVDRAMTNRPELVSLERQREAQELTVRAAKGGYGPTLSANAGASEAGTALDNLGPTWNIGAALTWPLFQGGLTVGQVREAEANLDFTHAQAEGVRLQVRFDVEQALLGLRAAKATVVAADEVLVNTRERLRLAEGRYTAGVGSIIELADAQLAVASSSTQLVQSQFNVSTARANLLAALGRR